MTNSHSRFLGTLLAQDVKARNMVTFYIACFCSIMVASFVPQCQPFILTEILNIPESQQGVISGKLNFAAEIAIIIATALAGPLSDRIGRRLVTAGGFLIMAAGIYTYPKATSIETLLAYRLFYSVGIAAVSTMIVTLVADYVADESRGKATGYLGIMNGIGAMVTVFVLLRLPSMFQSNGASAPEAAQMTYSIVAGICVAIGVLMLLGLKRNSSKPEQKREDHGFIELSRKGLLAARDPGIALAYGASFLARGNLMIVGTFFSLWIIGYGTTELGMTSADALKQAGMIIGIAQFFALMGAPVFGILSDKINRVTALKIALAVSAVGYGSTIFIDNPTGTGMLICAIFIGLGEIGCIITSGVLVAQQTPEKIRGATIGFFSMSGAVGILVASLVGGYLFDYWLASGPFVFFGVIALLILIWAIVVKDRIVPYSESPQHGSQELELGTDFS